MEVLDRVEGRKYLKRIKLSSLFRKRQGKKKKKENGKGPQLSIKISLEIPGLRVFPVECSFNLSRIFIVIGHHQTPYSNWYLLFLEGS